MDKPKREYPKEFPKKDPKRVIKHPPATKKLTKKQEKFVKAYAATGNRAEAVRQAYNASTPGSVTTVGNKLMQRPHIQRALEKMKEKYVKLSDEALQFQVETMRNDNAPMNIRNAIADSIQDRAGLGKKQDKQDVDIYAGGIVVQWAGENQTPEREVIESEKGGETSDETHDNS